jgi:uncharacterized protein with HEPN domain
MIRDFSHFQKDIINSCEKINEYINPHTFDSFVKDGKAYDAILMNFAIIGEAASHFSEEIKKNNQGIDWRTIIAMRNFLIHEYFEIDPKIIWQTAKENIPELLLLVQKMQIEEI